MNKFKGLSIISVIFCWGLSITQARASSDCPNNLSIVDKGVLSPLVGATLAEVYKSLGCPVIFKALPGRRGIALFNNQEVSGEVMRLEKAETAYSRNFVRSSVPILELHSSLWQHPDVQPNNLLPIGYTLGIVWQEDYMADKRGRKFNNAEELFSAYRAGELAGFLSSDITVKMLVANGKVTPKPWKKETIVTAPLYHYLGAEFTPFMARFSAYVQQNSPFAYIAEE